MAVCAINVNVHSQVFRARPVHFDGVEFSECLNEVFDFGLVLPDHCKVVDDKGEPDAAVMITK